MKSDVAHPCVPAADPIGDVAHDFNNILASILCYAALLKYDVKGQPQAEEHLAEVIRSAQRGKDRVRELMATHGGAGRVALQAAFSRPPQSPAPSRAAADDQDLEHGNGEHVLLVDDEAGLAGVEKRLLEMLGYRVTVFTCSEAARDALMRAPDDFDLLLADQAMPGLSGFELAAIAKRLRPQLPVLIATGYIARVDPVAAAAEGVDEILSKPFSRESLADAVKRSLDKSRRHPTVTTAPVPAATAGGSG